MVPRLHRSVVLVDGVFMFLVSVIFALHCAAWCGGRDKWFLLKATSTGRPQSPRFSVKGQRSPKQIKQNMNTTDINKNLTAPSVTIAPRNPARGVLTFVVTLTTFKDVRSYPCRSLESATKLAERFIAGVTKPRPAAQPDTTPAPAAEPVAA